MVHIFRAVPVESLKLVVFDLDGTLIDSRQDLCNSVNATLGHFGMKALPDDVIAGYIGDGAQMLIRRALTVPGEMLPGMKLDDAADEGIFARAFEFFLTYYRAHKLDFTYVYPGVFESLEALKGLPGLKMAVLTNKPVGPARAICGALGLTPYFFGVSGGDSFSTKKPDPMGLNALIAEAGVSAGETLMVGDSDVDVKTARNAGAWTLGCSFGLSPESLAVSAPDVAVDSAAEWAGVLGASQIEAEKW
jgi:phosphoglycolate phosphatase